VFDTLDPILQAEYKSEGKEGEEGAGYILDVSAVDGFNLEDVTGMKSTISAVRAERDDALGKLKILEKSSGKAADRIKKLEEAAGEDKINEIVETKMSQEREKHALELGESNAVGESLKSELDIHLRTNAIKAQLATITDEDGVKLLAPMFLDQVVMQYDEASKKHVARVIDSKTNNVRISEERGNNAPMSVQELVALSKDDPLVARVANGDGISGTGSTGNNETGRFDKGVVGITESDARDISKYRTARAAAEKQGATLQVIPDN